MGFLLTLREILRTRDGGLVSAGIPCASYVFMSLGSSCRDDANPYGDENRAFVKVANDICCRCSWIFLVAMIRCVAFCVEQPASTRLYAMPYMIYLENVAAAVGIPFHNRFLCLTCTSYIPYVSDVDFSPDVMLWTAQLSWMGIFGHFSSKPSRAWGTSWEPLYMYACTVLHTCIYNSTCISSN